jgi:type II secretory pathway component PulM
MAGRELKERSKEKMIQAGVALACILAAYFFLIKPAASEIYTLRESIRTSQSRLKLFEEIVVLTAKEKELRRLFEEQTNKSLLIGKIADAASKERISVQSVTPKDEPSGEYTKMILEMDLRSPFTALVRYLGACEKMKPIFRVKAISITKETERQEGAVRKGPRLVQGRLILETLLLKTAGKSK